MIRQCEWRRFHNDYVSKSHIAQARNSISCPQKHQKKAFSFSLHMKRNVETWSNMKSNYLFCNCICSLNLLVSFFSVLLRYLLFFRMYNRAHFFFCTSFRNVYQLSILIIEHCKNDVFYTLIDFMHDCS